MGVVLREKEYPKVAKALFVLGALLYTLSVFLIAQIFNTSVSLQGISWLLLICLVGVTFTAYFFSSYVSLYIALIEFLFWLGFQFTSLFSRNGSEFSFVFFVFLFLIAGIFFYGLGLIHRVYSHKFSKLFQWWTAFYFLAFFFIMSFQSIIPILWNSDLNFSGSPVVFLIIFGIISVIIFGSGFFFSMNNDNISKKETLIFIAIVIVLIGLIFMAKISTSSLGVCQVKSCYNLKSQDECNSPENSYLKCQWKNDYCSEKSCYDGRTENECLNQINNGLDCIWQNNHCSEKSCYIFQTQSECIDSSDTINCRWNANYCSESSCYTFDTPADCVNPNNNLDCQWSQNRCTTQLENSCSVHNNNPGECALNQKCQWLGTGYGFFGSRTQDLPSGVLFTWILINILFILFIIAIIGYGSLEKFPELINLGITAFSLDIFVRYIGFVMDLWGYTSMAIIFIIGGIILIFGGWFVEKWRKNLVSQVKNQVKQNAPV